MLFKSPLSQVYISLVHFDRRTPAPPRKEPERVSFNDWRTGPPKEPERRAPPTPSQSDQQPGRKGGPPEKAPVKGEPLRENRRKYGIR